MWSNFGKICRMYLDDLHLFTGHFSTPFQPGWAGAETSLYSTFSTVVDFLEMPAEAPGMNFCGSWGFSQQNRVLERPNNQQNVAITTRIVAFNGHKLIQKPEPLNAFFQESGLPWVVLTYSNQSIDGRLLYLQPRNFNMDSLENSCPIEFGGCSLLRWLWKR